LATSSVCLAVLLAQFQLVFEKSWAHRLYRSARGKSLDNPLAHVTEKNAEEVARPEGFEPPTNGFGSLI